MKNVRIISVASNSKIYHKPGCRYTNRMLIQNQTKISKKCAKFLGMKVCRYCNSMNHHMAVEADTIKRYGAEKGMTFNYINGKLYVKTEIGCWKLVYIRGDEKIAVYHRNTTRKPLDFEHPEYERYHLQDDCKMSENIASCLNYIYEHDKYKAAVERGEKVTEFSSEKYRRREGRAEKKRQHKRIDYLFRMIERQNSELKKVSFC